MRSRAVVASQSDKRKVNKGREMDQRIFIRKKEAFRIEEEETACELSSFSGIELKQLALYQVYDIFHAEKAELEALIHSVLIDPLVDECVPESTLTPRLQKGRSLAVTALEGQYDPRASAAEDCLRLLYPETRAQIRSSKLYLFNPCLNDLQMKKLRQRLINPVDSEEKDLKQLALTPPAQARPMKTFPHFTSMDEPSMQSFLREERLAMSMEDLRLIMDYFRAEGREPNEVEIRVLDTYWSDHCRHSSFNTELLSIDNRSERFQARFERLLDRYEQLRKDNQRSEKPRCLMEMATLVGRDFRRQGKLKNLVVSDEINACTVRVDVDENGQKRPWYLLFKNETHNHPTEIEPFGGAATCLGGAIRDPLSGRAYVYQALRISGAGDIRKSPEETRENKLPQSEISRKAALGYASYGNQIGLATSAVREYIHPAYEAKRLELGAVVGAVPENGVQHAAPRPGDIVLLIGGRTGRDGVGGATGSSKAHGADSLKTSGAEVQKGNPVMERKIQRLFRNPELTRLIRKCNDFGAGGVAVAIGELAEGLDIQLDLVPLKYPGLSPVEIALSESQERMAVLVSPGDAERMISAARKENLEASAVAKVNADGHLRMWYQKNCVLDLKRSFLDSSGAPRSQDVVLSDTVQHPLLPTRDERFIENLSAKDIFSLLQEPNVGSQEGLQEQFDASIGRSTLFMPLGGRFGKSEEAVSAQALPVLSGSHTASLVGWGFQPKLADQSPYLMAAYSVVEAISRLIAAGAGKNEIYLSCQEYFRRLNQEPEAWGLVVQALLALIEAQEAFGTAAIGGKDSMSGSYEDLHVPPTLVTFAVTTMEDDALISLTLPEEEALIAYLPHQPMPDGAPDYEALKRHFSEYRKLAERGSILAGSPIRAGGLIEALVKMSLGNRVGITLYPDALHSLPLANSAIGGLVFAVKDGTALPQDALIIAHTDPLAPGISWRPGLRTSFDELQEALESYAGKVYPVLTGKAEKNPAPLPDYARRLAVGQKLPPFTQKVAKPRVLIPIFPGTNCEWDTKSAFEKAGASVTTLLIRDLTPDLAAEDLERFLCALKDHEIIALAGGFSYGDEPDGSARFIVNYLRSPLVAEALSRFLEKDRLMLGICNGFQALLKSGFLPGGNPSLRKDSDPTLFRNQQNRHVSRIVRTRVTTVSSPWLEGFTPGEVHILPVSHGEGRFVIDPDAAKKLFKSSQVAFQYVDFQAVPSMDPSFNPNGSAMAIEGIISPDGKILGKMGHPERFRPGLFRNIPDISEQTIFENAVRAFHS